VQVVDPSQPANAVDVDLAVAELEKMKSNLPAEDAEEDGAVASTSMASKGDSADGDVPMAEGTPMTTLTTEPVASQLITTEEAAAADEKPTDKLAGPAVDTSDEAMLVTDKMVIEARPSAPEEPLSGAARVKAALKAMGFLDARRSMLWWPSTVKTSTRAPQTLPNFLSGTPSSTTSRRWGSRTASSTRR